MKRVICGAFAALLSALLVCPVLAAAPSEIGVVLMHGKWGSPKGSGTARPRVGVTAIPGEQRGNGVVRPAAIRHRLSGRAEGN